MDRCLVHQSARFAGEEPTGIGDDRDLQEGESCHCLAWARNSSNTYWHESAEVPVARPGWKSSSPVGYIIIGSTQRWPGRLAQQAVLLKDVDRAGDRGRQSSLTHLRLVQHSLAEPPRHGITLSKEREGRRHFARLDNGRPWFHDTDKLLQLLDVQLNSRPQAGWYQKQNRPTDLLDFAYDTRHRLVSDPRDRYYALLALARRSD